MVQRAGAGAGPRRRREAHALGLQRDVTELLQAQHRLQQLAYTDPLTGLPNRHHLQAHLALALALAARAARSGAAVALLFCDLNGFKAINDRFGHAAGDAALRRCADRLRGAVRSTDLPLRHGGDEFLLLLADLPADRAAVAAAAVVDQIRAAFRPPLDLAGHPVAVTVSVGVALYPWHARNADELLHAADTAMYQRKNPQPPDRPSRPRVCATSSRARQGASPLSPATTVVVVLLRPAG